MDKEKPIRVITSMGPGEIVGKVINEPGCVLVKVPRVTMTEEAKLRYKSKYAFIVVALDSLEATT